MNNDPSHRLALKRRPGEAMVRNMLSKSDRLGMRLYTAPDDQPPAEGGRKLLGTKPGRALFFDNWAGANDEQRQLFVDFTLLGMVHPRKWLTLIAILREERS